MAWNSKRSSFIVDDIHSDFLAELMPGGTGDSNDFSYFGPQGSKNDNYFGSSFSPSAPYRSSVFLQQEPQGFTRLASFAALNRASFQQSNKEAGWEVVTDHCKNLQSIALYFAATSNSVTNLAFLDFFSHVLRLLQMTLKLRPESIPFDQLKGQFHELFPSDETSSTSTNTNASSSSSSTPPSIVDTDSNPPGPPSPQVSSSATTNPHPLSHSTSASTLSAPSSSPQHQQQQQQQHMNIQTGLSQGVLSKGGQNNSASPSSLMSDFAMSGPPPPVQSGFNSSTMAQFSSLNSLSNAYQQSSQQQFQQPQFTTQQQQNIGQNSIGFYGQQQQAAPFQMHDGFGMNQLGNNSNNNGNGVVGGKSLEQQKNDALSAPVNLSASSSTNSSGTSGLGAISNNSSSSNLNLSSLSNLTGLSSRNNAGGSGTNLAGSINNSVTNNVVGSSSSMFSGAYSQQVAPQLGLRNPNDHTNTTMGLPVSNTPNYLPPTVFTSNPFSGLPVSAQHNLMSRNNLLPIPVKPPINQSPEKQGPGQQPLQQPQQHLQYLPPQLQQQQQSQQQQMLPITHANLHAHLQGPHHPGQPFLRPKEPATSTSTSVAAASATLDHMPSDSAQMNKMMGAGFMMIPGMGYPGEFGKGMLDGSGGDPGWPKRKRKRVMSRTNLKCRICQETETPEWRKGPDGNHTLCNACGLNYAKKLKQERQVLEKAGRRRTSIDTILEDKKFHFSDLIASERAKKGTEKRPNPLRTASHSSQFPSEDGTNSGSADGDDQFSVPPPPSSSPSNSSSQSVKREYKHDDEDDDDEYEDDEDLQNNGSSSSGSNNDNDEAMRDFGNSRNAPGPSSHLNPANFGNNLQQQQQQQLQVHQHQQQQQQYQQQQQQQFGFNPSLPSRAESMGSLMNPNLNLNMGLSQSGPKLETSQSASSLQQLQQQQQQLQQQQGQGQNPQRPY